MLKISIMDGRTQRRLIVEGRLISPWVSELRVACEKAKSDLHDRELVMDLNNLTAISQEGENFLLELMQEGVTCRSCGAFTRHVLAQLARRVRRRA